jgi:hypothetical protein
MIRGIAVNDIPGLGSIQRFFIIQTFELGASDSNAPKMHSFSERL